MDILTVKAVHIIALVSWFAAMFYLPRLFVYHAENAENSGFVGVVKIMEAKLFKFIALPAFVLTIVTGVWLILLQPELLTNPAKMHSGWLHVKLTLFVLLCVWFFHSAVMLKQLARDTCRKSGKFFRFYNEIPTLFLIAIVLLAVLKPF
ncbi:UPF0093 membrane protein [Campylobacterota bacterium]|nr:UPF0093 membrane protein [Campylobacterota bacterium]